MVRSSARPLLSSLLLAACALVGPTAGCAAPAAEDEAGTSEGASSLGATIDPADLELLRDGSGLSCSADTESDTTLCVHDRGVVMLNADGVALLQAKGDVVSATARATDASVMQDVAEVLAGGSTGGAASTQSIRPLAGVGAMRALGTLGEWLITVGRRGALAEAEMLAARSAEKANDLGKLQTELRAGQSAIRSAEGATVLAGKSIDATVSVVKNWATATGRRIVGIRTSGPGAADTRDKEIAAVVQLLQAEKATLRPGERLAAFFSPLMGNRDVLAAALKRADIDVIAYFDRAPGFHVDALVTPPPGMTINNRDFLGMVATKMFQADTSFVGRVAN
jgi:hypothetical protein